MDSGDKRSVEKPGPLRQRPGGLVVGGGRPYRETTWSRPHETSTAWGASAGPIRWTVVSRSSRTGSYSRHRRPPEIRCPESNHHMRALYAHSAHGGVRLGSASTRGWRTVPRLERLGALAGGLHAAIKRGLQCRPGGPARSTVGTWNLMSPQRWGRTQSRLFLVASMAASTRRLATAIMPMTPPRHHARNTEIRTHRRMAVRLPKPSPCR